MEREQIKPIRVLLVEDSPAQQALLLALLRSSGEFEVVGTAADGQAAIEAADRLRPSVVAMDIHLPLMDGYEATRRIMQACPTPIVMFSNSAGDADQRAVQALAAGALAVVRKPGSLHHPGGQEERATFLKMLRLMAGVRVVTRHPPRSLTPFTPTPAERLTARPQLLAVAASTGGPAALQTFLSGLGPRFGLPVLVVQHIARGFTNALVDWLDGAVQLPVQLASAGERIVPGHVYLAPDDQHIVAASRGAVGLRPGRPDDRYCPSADLLFESVAGVYGRQAIGVIMTGMGDDGARGMRLLHDTGAVTLAQDEATSVVYGMPAAAAAAGAVTRIAPLGDLASVVLGLV